MTTNPPEPQNPEPPTEYPAHWRPRNLDKPVGLAALLGTNHEEN